MVDFQNLNCTISAQFLAAIRQFVPVNVVHADSGMTLY
jgi:hypothetical protein